MKAAGAATRKQQRNLDLITAGRLAIENEFEPQVRALQEQRDRLDFDPETIRPERGMAREIGGERAGIELEREREPLSLGPGPSVEDLAVGGVFEGKTGLLPGAPPEDVAVPDDAQKKVAVIGSVLEKLEAEYEKANMVISPEGKARADRIKGKIEDLIREKNRLQGISKFVHEDYGTYRGVHKPRPKPTPAMSGREFEDIASSEWFSIIQSLPGLGGDNLGEGGIIVEGPYAEKGFTMTQEIWDGLDDKTRRNVRARYDRVSSLPRKGNRYPRLGPDEFVPLKLITTKQAMDRKGRYRSSVGGPIKNTNADFIGWRTQFEGDPGKRAVYRPSQSKTQKDTINFNNALSDFNLVAQDYESVGGTIEASHAIEQAIGSVSTKTADGARRNSEEIRAEVARLVAVSIDVGEADADELVRLYIAKDARAKAVRAASRVVGKVEFKKVGVHTTPREISQLFTEISEVALYADVMFDEATEKGIEREEAKFEAGLKRSAKFRGLLDIEAALAGIREIPERIGPASYELLSGYPEGLKAVIEAEYLNVTYGEMSEANKAGVGYSLYIKMNKDPERYGEYFGGAEAVMRLVEDIEYQGLATKTDILDPNVAALIKSLRGSSPEKGLYINYLAKQFPGLPADAFEDLVE